MLSRGLRRLRQSAKGPGQSRRNVTDWRKPVGAIVSGKTVSGALASHCIAVVVLFAVDSQSHYKRRGRCLTHFFITQRLSILRGLLEMLTINMEDASTLCYASLHGHW